MNWVPFDVFFQSDLHLFFLRPDIVICMSEWISLYSESKFSLVVTWYSYSVRDRFSLWTYVGNFCMCVNRHGDLCLPSSVLSLASCVFWLCQPRLCCPTGRAILPGGFTDLPSLPEPGGFFCIWCEYVCICMWAASTICWRLFFPQWTALVPLLKISWL